MCKSQTTFILFFIRDVTHWSVDTFSIRPLVAAYRSCNSGHSAVLLMEIPPCILFLKLNCLLSVTISTVLSFRIILHSFLLTEMGVAVASSN